MVSRMIFGPSCPPAYRQRHAAAAWALSLVVLACGCGNKRSPTSGLDGIDAPVLDPQDAAVADASPDATITGPPLDAAMIDAAPDAAMIDATPDAMVDAAPVLLVRLADVVVDAPGATGMGFGDPARA